MDYAQNWRITVIEMFLVSHLGRRRKCLQTVFVMYGTIYYYTYTYKTYGQNVEDNRERYSWG